MAYAVIKLHCRDAKGIVYNVSKFIYDHGGNIISSLQHWEELDSRFIMRVQFDLSEVTCTRDELETYFAGIASDFGMQFEFSYSDRRKRLAIMVSKYDHCFYDLFLRYQYGELNADFALVVSNHPDLESASSFFKTPYYYIPMKNRQKEDAEKEILALFNEHRVDLVVLARYMQILTPIIVGAYPHKIINVHHGFLPAFKGAKPYHQAYARGVKIIGATSHYVTEELDMGPIIEQETIRVGHTHGIQDMLRMGRDIERRVLSRAVKAHIEDRIIIYRNRTYVFD